MTRNLIILTFFISALSFAFPKTIQVESGVQKCTRMSSSAKCEAAQYTKVGEMLLQEHAGDWSSTVTAESHSIQYKFYPVAMLKKNKNKDGYFFRIIIFSYADGEFLGGVNLELKDSADLRPTTVSTATVWVSATEGYRLNLKFSPKE